MTSTHSTSAEDRMAALEVSNHGIKRQLDSHQEEFAGIRNSIEALADSIAQMVKERVDDAEGNSLKKQLGQADRAISDLPNVDDEGLMTLEPDQIVDFRWTRRGRQVLQEALVHWTGNVQLDWTAASRGLLIPYPDQSCSNEQEKLGNKE
nr:hypothetical protein CFP56_41218 [Quercus suber]